MSNRGKRGASKGSKDLPESSYYIEFNKNNEPCGENTAAFMNDFNRLCDKHLQYYMTWKQIKNDLWDHVWSKIKNDWNIPDDRAKKVMRTKANARHRKFRCTLHNEFVKTGLNPKRKYNLVDETKWSLFVSQCNELDFQERSAKAKESVQNNTNPSHLGRTSYAELEATWKADWNILVLHYPWLSDIQNDRSKMYILGHSKKNKTTGLREIPQPMEEICRQLLQTEKSMLADGTYFIAGRDPLTEVIGDEHGGRTKAISSSLGVRTTLNWVHENRQTHDQVLVTGAFKDQIMNELRGEIKAEMRADIIAEVRAEVIAEIRGEIGGFQNTRQTTVMQPELEPRLQGISSPTPYIRDSSCASGGSYDGFDDIEEATECDLLWPYPDSDFQVASGMVHPTRDGIIHGTSMSRGYVKVQVDTVETEYLRIPVPKADGEVKFLEDAIHHFIQWPRDKVRIKHTMSPRRCISHLPRGPPMELQTPMNDLSSSSCYRPQMEEDTMTLFQNQMPRGGYMSLLNGQMPLDSQMDASTGLPPMIEQSMTSPLEMSQPSTSSPTSSEMGLKRKRSNKEIKERLAKLNKMPKKWKDSAKRFKVFNNKRNIRIVSPPGMYVKQWTEDAGYHDILDLHINTRLSVTIIHWWSMCLYQRAESRGGNKCAFLNANVTTMCTKSADLVVHHIRETRKTHPKKQIYVAPFCQSDKQWVLFLVCPNLKKGYIVDSSRYGEKSEKDYCLTPILESAFATSFEWAMVKCCQQKEEWESGYYLLHHMYELVISKQADFPQNLWNDARHLTQSEIYDIAFVSSSEFYKSAVIPLSNGDSDDADDASQ